MGVKELDGFKCRVWGCGNPNNLEEHHIIPRSQGGSNQVRNLITLCHKHHSLITQNKLSMIAVLSQLKSKQDFRWGISLVWLLKRKNLRKYNGNTTACKVIARNTRRS